MLIILTTLVDIISKVKKYYKLTVFSAVVFKLSVVLYTNPSIVFERHIQTPQKYSP